MRLAQLSQNTYTKENISEGVLGSLDKIHTKCTTGNISARLV